MKTKFIKIADLISIKGDALSKAGTKGDEISKEIFYEITRQTVFRANQRIRALRRDVEKSNMPSPYALIERFEGQKEFKFDKSMNLNQVKHQYILARNFLSSKTSTIKGWKEVLRDTENRLGIATGRKLNKNEWSVIWKLFNELWSNDRIRATALATYGSSDKLQQIITQYVIHNKSTENLYNDIIENMYKQYYEIMEEEYGFEDFDREGSYFSGGSNR